MDRCMLNGIYRLLLLPHFGFQVPTNYLKMLEWFWAKFLPLCFFSVNEYSSDQINLGKVRLHGGKVVTR
jgi:hypothetical protein